MKRKRKGAYDKSGGITHDTAAFAFRTKDILKIRSRPRLEPGSDYHYLSLPYKKDACGLFDLQKARFYAGLRHLDNPKTKVLQKR